MVEAGAVFAVSGKQREGRARLDLRARRHAGRGGDGACGSRVAGAGRHRAAPVRRDPTHDRPALPAGRGVRTHRRVRCDSAEPAHISTRCWRSMPRSPPTPIDGIIETVPTYRSLMVHFDPADARRVAISWRGSQARRPRRGAAPRAPRHWRIPACWDPPYLRGPRRGRRPARPRRPTKVAALSRRGAATRW